MLMKLLGTLFLPKISLRKVIRTVIIGDTKQLRMISIINIDHYCAINVSSSRENGSKTDEGGNRNRSRFD